MDWKEFIKPTRGKLVWFVLLFIILSVLQSFYFMFFSFDAGLMAGSPLPAYSYGGGLQSPGEPVHQSFYAPFLVIDVVFWYLISCAIIAYRQKKKG